MNVKLFRAMFLATMLASCCMDDCLNGVRLKIRLINSATGRDLIFEEGIPETEFKFTASSGSRIDYFYVDAGEKLIDLDYYDGMGSINIEYDSRTVSLTPTLTYHKAPCCGDYETTNVEGNNVTFSDGIVTVRL